jgi:Dyp-type peroxidase family
LPSEPLLDALDIQGNIIPGFQRAKQLLVGFSGDDLGALKRALGVVASRLTTLADALGHRDLRKAFYVGRSQAIRDVGLWMNYALGRRAFTALGLPDVDDLDLAFVIGMVPSRTGDAYRTRLADGTPNPAAPENWVVGGPTRPLDFLLLFAADDDIEAAARATIESVISCGLTRIYSEVGTLLPGLKEHFGFQDGISVPGTLGLVEIDGIRRYVTTRYGVPDDNGVSYGKPGQPLVDPSQFLFEDGPLKNGSFLVFRRLHQDVEAFYSDSNSIASNIGAALGTGVTAEVVRSRIVGRWPSGEPLMRRIADAPQPEADICLNYFDFARPVSDVVLSTGERISGSDGDPQVGKGGRCPIWAHIRKVNPRDLPTNKGGPDETRGFQMLRRGIPYGPIFDHVNTNNPVNKEDRGLLFLAYQRSISTQFEELNGDWMNSQNNPMPGGFDLLVGQSLDASGQNIGKPAVWFDVASSNSVQFMTPRQWVLPTGGAYLFAPPIGWSRQIAATIEIA